MLIAKNTFRFYLLTDYLINKLTGTEYNPLSMLIAKNTLRLYLLTDYLVNIMIQT